MLQLLWLILFQYYVHCCYIFTGNNSTVINRDLFLLKKSRMMAHHRYHLRVLVILMRLVWCITVIVIKCILQKYMQSTISQIKWNHSCLGIIIPAKSVLCIFANILKNYWLKNNWLNYTSVLKKCHFAWKGSKRIQATLRLRQFVIFFVVVRLAVQS